MKKLMALLTVFALLTGALAVDSAVAAPKKDKEAKEKSNNRDNENSNRDNENSNRDNENNNRDNENRNAGVLIYHYTHTIVMPDGSTCDLGLVKRVSRQALKAHLAHGDADLADEDAMPGEPCWRPGEDNDDSMDT